PRARTCRCRASLLARSDAGLTSSTVGTGRLRMGRRDGGRNFEFTPEELQLRGEVIVVLWSQVLLMRPTASLAFPAGTTHPEDTRLDGRGPLRKLAEDVTAHGTPRSGLTQARSVHQSQEWCPVLPPR